MNKLNVYFRSNKLFIIFLIVFVLLRILILNINYTEWGDTFRMIRGAEYLVNFDWPWDEKRWPLYSLFLVPGIIFDQPILWGRVLSLFISIGIAFYVYHFYLRFFSRDKFFATVAVIFTVTTSVFAYWSIRVMADPLFALLCIAFLFHFMSFYKSKMNAEVVSVLGFSINQTSLKIFGLSIVLLMITMTRLEGLFLAASTFGYLLLTKRWKDITIFAIPQVLIYLPWTLYAKVIYSGNVQNDYLQEVQTFVFNLDRFIYFFVYTAFILVIPITLFFIVVGLHKFYKKRARSNKLVLLPLFGFIGLELLIGFIWTPSLPRIYVPIIPFISMFLVYGIQKVKFKNHKIKYFVVLIFSILLFGFFQYQLKLYFLGASKILFGLILLGSISLVMIIVLFEKFRKLILIGIIILNLIISYVVINNQKDIYKTVKKSIEYVETNNIYPNSRIAYSDETGTNEWYLRKNSFYLNPSANISEEAQYETFKKNDVDYFIWTNEFNRGSSFFEPDENDIKYEMIFSNNLKLTDGIEDILQSIGVINNSKYTEFETRVYKIIYEE